MRLVTNSLLNLTPYNYPDKIKVSTHKEDIMKAIGTFFSGMFKTDATSGSSFRNEWEKARVEASRFGPSHVAEIDAIFSRQS